MQRRSFMKWLSAGAGALATGTLHRAQADGSGGTASNAPIKHSASKWCYSDFSVDELADAGAEMGLHSVELLDPEDWPAAKKHGLTCAMSNAPKMDAYGIEKGWNNPENHDTLISLYETRIPKVAEAGLPNLICFSGNRNGRSDEQGLQNCVAGLEQIVPLAEEYDVTLCMELLNSKVDHPGYQCDRTTWGVELVDRLGSDHFRLLYDIYHMQIMEGDVIRTIRNHHDAIAHYHTGGVPGRHEIDGTQELHYPAIVRAIAETGYDGYIGQEFVPTADDPLRSLREAMEICTV
ncbi:MAG: hydroxypyruvate isomerase family protein [Salinibacter sp.]